MHEDNKKQFDAGVPTMDSITPEMRMQMLRESTTPEMRGFSITPEQRCCKTTASTTSAPQVFARRKPTIYSQLRNLK